MGGPAELSWEALVGSANGGQQVAAAPRSRRPKEAVRDDGDPSSGIAIRRGVIRYVVLVLDMSVSSAQNDLRPSRGHVLSTAAAEWIRLFFSENPLSLMSVVVLRASVALRLTELSSSSSVHFEAASNAFSSGCRGSTSLQNAIELSIESLKATPKYSSREVVFLMSSLSSCDPGDVFEAIEAAKEESIRISMIQLGAEVYVSKMATKKTNGTYAVALDAVHLRSLLRRHALPPPTTEDMASSAASPVPMGFPKRHNDPASGILGSWSCPQCRARTASTPASCAACGLSLIASPHLARTYHHLFPAPGTIDVDDWEEGAACIGCGISLRKQQDSFPYQCRQCQGLLCDLCDSFVQDTLHNCPGCLGR